MIERMKDMFEATPRISREEKRRTMIPLALPVSYSMEALSSSHPFDDYRRPDVSILVLVSLTLQVLVNVAPRPICRQKNQ